MKKIDTFFKNKIVKVLTIIFLTIIPAYDFYSNLVKKILTSLNIANIINIPTIDFGNQLPDILTGLLLAGMFILYTKSRNEYIRVKDENKRIREMLLTIHLFDNIRFSKIKSGQSSKLFINEENLLRPQLKTTYKHDLGEEYTDEDIQEILDTFYHQKPKFIQKTKS